MAVIDVIRNVWNRNITYQEVDNLNLRTDRAFRIQSQKEHHHLTSPFIDLLIDMILDFLLDYMQQL